MMKRFAAAVLAVAVMNVAAFGANVVVKGDGVATDPGDKSVVAVKAVPFRLEEVRLRDGAFKRAQEVDHRLLLSLDADRLLHTFKLNAGLPTNAKPYGGWEAPNCELRGHSMGHYLSALSMMYASTGDAKLKQRVDYIVGELAKCQVALAAKGSNPGYLSAFPESFFDRNDKHERVWAPWYTMHKIMAGLLDAYTYCHNKQALAVDTKLAEWVKFRVDRLPTAQFQRSLENEQGGMNEVMANLSAATGNGDFLQVAQAFNHQAVFGPLAKGEDKLDGLHANTQIPKIIGAAREYELTGNETYEHIADFFWKEVALKRSYVFGGHSDNEHFFPIRDFAKHLSPATAETCNTYNMLKLTRHVFAWDPSAVAMDFYERALYNDILASQDPETGMMTYFMSTKPDHFKTYSTKENSFWCCFGTGMENHSKYGDTIYFRSPDEGALYVNLFIPSTLNWKEKHLRVVQETTFPEQETSKLTFHCEEPEKLAVKVRVPEWAQGATAEVDGKSVAFGGAGSYATIDREWKDGDVLEVKLPMRLHLVDLPHSDTEVAVMYGPVVLAGDFGKADMKTLEAKNQGDYFKVKDPMSPALAVKKGELLAHIKPVEGWPLRFRTVGIGKPEDFTLVPFNEITDQRYTVYWKVER